MMHWTQNGADENSLMSTTRVAKLHRAPLHMAANQSGRYFGWNRYGGFMKAIDNVRRPSDAIDTFRVLVEAGQCDSNAKTPSRTPEQLWSLWPMLIFS